jgi:hypothetical protein
VAPAEIVLLVSPERPDKYLPIRPSTSSDYFGADQLPDLFSFLVNESPAAFLFTTSKLTR